MGKIKAVLVDNRPYIGEALAKTIQDEALQEIDYLPDLESFYNTIETGIFYNVGVISYTLTGKNTAKHIRKIIELNQNIKIIVISQDTSGETIMDILLAGAVGFLPEEEVCLQRIIDTIKIVSKVGILIDQSIVTNFLGYCAQCKNGTQNESLLSNEQVKILKMACEGKSNKEIAEQLNLSLPTIKLRFRDLCKKLGARDRTQAVIEAIKGKMLPLDS